MKEYVVEIVAVYLPRSATKPPASHRGHGRVFNLILGTKLYAQEKQDLVSFLRTL
jgi:hypothetical protein